MANYSVPNHSPLYLERQRPRAAWHRDALDGGLHTACSQPSWLQHQSTKLLPPCNHTAAGIQHWLEIALWQAWTVRAQASLEAQLAGHSVTGAALRRWRSDGDDSPAATSSKRKTMVSRCISSSSSRPESLQHNMALDWEIAHALPCAIPTYFVMVPLLG